MSSPNHGRMAAQQLICDCANICNRKEGRGSCVCLKNSQKCSLSCTCGTNKMSCQNQPSNNGKKTSLSPSALPEVPCTPQSTPKTVKKRGRKPKYLTPSEGGSKVENGIHHHLTDIPSVEDWLILDGPSSAAHCRYCDCDFKGKSRQLFLQHARTIKHERNADRWAQEHSGADDTSGATPDQGGKNQRKVFIHIADFKPWLAVNKLSGDSYCSYCKMAIRPGNSISDIKKHKSSKKHKQIESEVASGGGQSNKSTVLGKENLEAQGDNTLTPSKKKKRKKQKKAVRDEEAEAEVDDEFSPWEETEDEEIFPSSAGEIQRQTSEVKAALVNFMVENDVPLDRTGPLVQFIKRLPSAGFAVENTALGQEDACDIMMQSDVGLSDDILISKLKQMLFSIAVDVKTDFSGGTHLAVFAFYGDDDLQSQVSLLDVPPIEDCSAETIYQKLRETLVKAEQGGVPLSNCRALLCDAPNIPLSTMTSVMSLLVADYDWMMPVACPSHMGEMALIAAVKPICSELEIFCQLLHKHFLSGPVLGLHYLQYQGLCQMKTHPIVAGSSLPWVVDGRFLSCLLDQWSHLQSYFSDLGHSSNTSDDDIARILETLSDPIKRLELTVLQYLREPVTNLDSRHIHLDPFFLPVSEVITEDIRTFANFFIIGESVLGSEDILQLNIDDETYYQPLSQVHLGHALLEAFVAENKLSSEDPKVLQLLRSTREMYKGIVRDLQMRLKLIRPAYKLSDVIHPEILMGLKDEVHLVNKILGLFNNSEFVDLDAIHVELGDLTTDVGLRSCAMIQPPRDFWRQLLESSGMYKNLCTMAQFYFSLPLSSSAVSKLFGQIKGWNVDAYLRLSKLNVGDYLLDNDYHASVQG